MSIHLQLDHGIQCLRVRCRNVERLHGTILARQAQENFPGFYVSSFKKIPQLLHEKVFRFFVSLLRVQPEPMGSDNIHSTPCFCHKGQGGIFVTNVDTQILFRQTVYLRIRLSFQ